MNISLMRLKPAVRELAGIRTALERIAECMEIDMAQQGFNVRPPKADTSGPDPGVSYTNEEDDFMRESNEFLKRQEQRMLQEEAEKETGGLGVLGQNNRETL